MLNSGKLFRTASRSGVQSWRVAVTPVYRRRGSGLSLQDSSFAYALGTAIRAAMTINDHLGTDPGGGVEVGDSFRCLPSLVTHAPSTVGL